MTSHRATVTYRVDDSAEDTAAFLERSARRPHIQVPTMTGPYSFEAHIQTLFTNHTATAEGTT